MNRPPRRLRATHVLTALALALPGWAQEVEQSELDQLDKALVEFSDIAAPHNPADVQRIEDLHAEIVRLQASIIQFDTQMQDLRAENARLREALRLRYGAGSDGLPPVPMPHRDLIESVLDDAPGGRPATPAARPAALDLNHEVVKEWGRTPEVVATMRGNVSSLKGMAIVVPNATPAEALIQLGKQLRQEYDAYDNLNIEIFDDRDAAEKFANTGSTDSFHRAMSISKHTSSGRDVILIMRDGAITQIR